MGRYCLLCVAPVSLFSSAFHNFLFVPPFCSNSCCYAGVVDFHDALLWTLLELAHPNVVIYSVFCDRPWSFMFFAKLADTHQFDVRPVEVKKDDDCDEDAGINMHVITCRR